MREGGHEVRHEPVPREGQPHRRPGNVEEMLDDAARALRLQRPLMDQVEEGLLLGGRSSGNVHGVAPLAAITVASRRRGRAGRCARPAAPAGSPLTADQAGRRRRGAAS